MENPKEEPKQTDEKGRPMTYWGGLEEAASTKVEAKLAYITSIANDSDAYWKMDTDRQAQLKERDLFEQKVWSYILELIEKDNKL